MSKSIQIVAFDNPNPPDYGGVIDVYYKIEALHALGVKIDLHLFNYGNRENIDPLTKICESVFQYDRNMGIGALFSSTPFIVKSRENNDLLNTLSKNPAPILFEGLHCCSFLNHPRLKNHFKIVRTHNVEHSYYEGLFNNSSNLLKKLYYRTEAKKLKVFEPVLEYADLICSLSLQDATYFQQYQKTEWVPPFHQVYPEILKTEDYILFHGNLAVEENINALSALLKNVFKELRHKIIVAGNSPPQKIIKAIGANKAITLITNPSEEEMTDLICNAKCHILYTNQNTGVKLKLVHAIQTSGHIVLNDAMLFDERFKDEVEIANDWISMVEKLNQCMAEETVKPRPKLKALFDNKKNAEKILSFLN
ncbi:glycosyltransferase [Aequorivita capsosiphonis]|uniref:glycosyltransferase n=1 Tax=Aequorivita capsosiphonis TaxID=487317 RepID=UPI00040191AC|nr:glycosyltransferase [Aequorivita capsosiphonis]